MTPEFDARERAVADAVSTVLTRWINQPQLYRSRIEFYRALAEVYRARAGLYAEAVQYAIDHPGTADGIVFAALCHVRAAADRQARDYEEEADRAEREDADRAWRSYADNLVAAAGVVRS